MGTKRVLIVGYEMHALDGLAASVERYCLECEVAVARGGVEALERFQEHPADLVLTEYQLPDMTGVELAQAVHRLSPGTRIVLMVDPGAEQGAQAPSQSLLPGAAKARSGSDPRDTIRKPVGIEQLWKVVHSLN